MFLYLFHTLLGPQPPPHPEVYWPFNLPWLIAPVVLMLRMRAPEPFAR